MFFFPIHFEFDKKAKKLIKFDIHLQSFTVCVFSIKY